MADICSSAEAAQIASDLLSIGAFTFRPDEPFTWASGMQSPVYCDNRLTLSYPEVRARIVSAFISCIKNRNLQADAIVGVATAGIPHAAFLASQLDLPMAYVRSQPKGHGRQNQIEGEIRAGQKAILIEDLVSTGGSVIGAIKVLQQKGIEVEAVLAVFSYELPEAKSAFSSVNIPLYVLVSFKQILEVAVAGGMITDTDATVIKEWHNDPRSWENPK